MLFNENNFRDILDDLSLTFRRAAPGVFVMGYHFDQVELNCNLMFIVEDGLIKAFATIPGFGASVSRDAKVERCNRWNREKALPKAYVDDDGDVMLQISQVNDETLDPEYVKVKFVVLSIAMFKSFYEEFAPFVKENS